MTERTLIVIKPDAIQRNLTGEIISRLEKKGFKLVAAKLIQISYQLAEKHYRQHKGKDFYDRLCRYLSSSASLVMVWEAENIIHLSRKLMGETFANDAVPGTIRGDYSCTKTCNLVHGSDSLEAAEYEISLYFSDDEIISYELSVQPWLSGNFNEM